LRPREADFALDRREQKAKYNDLSSGAQLRVETIPSAEALTQEIAGGLYGSTGFPQTVQGKQGKNHGKKYISH
jgi:hypothetical protein